MRPVWAEINLENIKHNFREVKRLAQKSEPMPVIKANAYGHGAVEVAKALIKEGAKRFAVAIVDEGIKLREAGILEPILILGHTPPDDLERLLFYNLIPTIHHRDMALAYQDKLSQLKRNIICHLKIDTGMGRIGFWHDDLTSIAEVFTLKNIEVEGIYTHFARSDEKDLSFSRLQLERFNNLLSYLARQGITVKYRHAANSAAIMRLPEAHLDLVRPGIMLYGEYPSGDVPGGIADLRPALTLKAKVSQVKRVPAGFPVSYGSTYITKKSTLIVSLPLGYADGYFRLLSNRGVILLNGRRWPIAGRVCMDQLMVAVDEKEIVNPGDEAVLLGNQGKETITAMEVAGLIGTINYEVLTNISTRVPRIYV
ncbi:alanine racemase [Carboxydothermus pertinax]|uniref:Alanine racemase n=1 Tax=Carboxydothermus pertinax TaxID=870242 RepID=A0A1L8CSK5_9THEO|nr:alanine racemase [Carboxydothermus pertinax]GAV21903.1 alanine racemase [Carboxydothermus pertinax]